MNTDELKTLFDTIITLIEKNRNAINPQLLNKIEGKINDIKKPNIQAAICAYFEITQPELDNLFELAATIIDKERTTLNNGTDIKISNALKTLKDRPLILNTIALLI